MRFSIGTRVVAQPMVGSLRHRYARIEFSVETGQGCHGYAPEWLR
jgi:hypothetical protein